MLYKSAGILLLLLQFLPANTTLSYREKTGKKVETSTVDISYDGKIMKSRFENRDIIVEGSYVPGEGTRTSRQIDVETNDTLTLSRVENRIEITRGNSSDTLPIDTAPWIADINNLKEFVLSGKKSKTFWIISSNFSEMENVGDGVLALKFKISFKERDTIEVRGELKEITHYQLRMADWRSILWKAEYWFNAEGIHIRSEQKRGGPFTKKTYTTLTSIEEN